MRDVRLDAGLSGRALSAAAGWHEAKTSRIESAKQAPSDSDIRSWCQACGTPDEAVDLIAASRAADSMYMEWKRLHRTGMRRVHGASAALYERTRHFKGLTSLRDSPRIRFLIAAARFAAGHARIAGDARVIQRH